VTVPSPEAGKRPVIGITAYATRAAWGVWDVEACLAPQRYVDAVVRTGGLPVVLPPLPGLTELLLPRLDGLVIAGGPDVDPARYDAEPGPDTQPPSRMRDAAENGLLAAATGLRLPVLGVCRGMHMMNVARGGTLVQHLPDLLGTDLHCPALGRFGRHDVLVDPGTRLAEALGLGTASDPDLAVSVPTYHHQAVDVLGAGLVVVARAADGVIEAVEDLRLPFWLGVQWHPEMGEDLSVFAALVSAARAGALAPAGRVGAGRR
jgi:gamma-glutamyl-gamma-aminobutyrate hydrolase PuuD